ncbi:MAG: hypothetical protein WD904_11275 [Dehalococcoidia bacterium]
MVIATTPARQETPLPQQLTNLDTARLRAYRENLEFYEGRRTRSTE